LNCFKWYLCIMHALNKLVSTEISFARLAWSTLFEIFEVSYALSAFTHLIVCFISSSVMRELNETVKDMNDSAMLLTFTWEDEKKNFSRSELNDCELLLLQSCFCIVTMLNSWTSLSIRNDSWILNDFLMLYCRICRKDCFIIKLFITVVDFAMRRLFVCFQSSRVFLTFWLNISESAQMSSCLSHYLRKRKDRLISF